MKTTLRKYLAGKNYKVETLEGLHKEEYLESNKGESLYLFFENEKPARPTTLFETVIDNLDNIFVFTKFSVASVTYGILDKSKWVLTEKILKSNNNKK